MCQRPQLFQRLLGGCLELADTGCRAKRVVQEHVLHDAQLDAHRDKPLLRAVVEIALDAPPLVVGAGGDRARDSRTASAAPSASASRRRLSRATAASAAPIATRAPPAPRPTTVRVGRGNASRGSSCG